MPSHAAALTQSAVYGLENLSFRLSIFATLVCVMPVMF